MAKYILSLIFCSFFLCLQGFAQYNKVRKIRIDPKEILVIEGWPWDYDEPQEANFFNDYVLLVEKDSSKIDIASITKNYSTPGTRNTLKIDSMARPVKFSGNRDYDDNPYSYVWNWGTDGRLISVEEFKNGKLLRRIPMAEAKKPKKKK